MKLFISFSSRNRRYVQELGQDLEAFGHTVWFDAELSGGMAWWDTILKQIRECDVFVLALTPEALESYPVKLELTYAASLNKPILPVLLADVDIKLLPQPLSVIQYVDYRQRDRHSALTLGKAISSLPPAKPLPDPLPPPPELPLAPLIRLKTQLNAPTLSFEEQLNLVFELKSFLSRQETYDDARQLLEALRARADVYARVGYEIDGLLNKQNFDTSVFVPPQDRVPALPKRSLLDTVRVKLITLLGGTVLTPTPPNSSYTQAQPDFKEGSVDKLHHIFISYSKYQRKYARSYADFLLQNGFDVWIDDRIEYGEDWWETIVRAITDCDAFTVIMTPDSDASKWVKREVALADKLDKPMFPILLHGENWPIFILTQFVDVRNQKLPPMELVERIAKFIPPRDSRGRNVTIVKSL